MSTTTTASTATATCPGCGRVFKNERGLASHQNHRNAKTSCKSDEARAELSKPVMVEDATGTAVEALDAFNDAVDAIQGYGEATADLPDEDAPDQSDATKMEVRDQVIKEARRYARVPDFPTTLVHLTGIESVATPTAWRWHPEDAVKLMNTAFSSSVVRITKHDDGRKGETVVTDFHWLDGLRARVTEKFAI